MIEIDIIRDETDEPFVVAVIRSQSGTLKALAETSFENGCLVLDGLHVHGLGIGPNALGPGRLRKLIREVADALGVEAVLIRGADRTSGAHPGHRPRPIRIARKSASDGDDQ